MMNQQQPDNFFKDRLENIQQPAPSTAWMRIEKGLAKKNNKGLWLKVAAALLAVAVVSYLMWPHHPAGPAKHPAIADHEIRKEKSQDAILPKEELTAKAEDHEPVDQRERENIAKTAEKNSQNKINTFHTTANKDENIDENKTEEPDKVEDLSEPVENNVALDGNRSTETVAVETEKKDHNFKLVIETDEVNAKYLDKKSFAQATPEEQKSSRLKKLLDKAYDLKNNQDPFGELRQKKNEILALNIQGDRKQGQNK